MPTVNIDELEQAIALLLRHIREDKGITEIEIDRDQALYWSFPIDKVANISRQPESTDLSIGSVADDIEFLSKMVNSARSTRDAPVPMLEHASGVLRYLAATIKG